jgi:hypothetical protein
MSSSRGDARAAKRARTGGAETDLTGAFTFAFRGAKVYFGQRNRKRNLQTKAKELCLHSWS